MAMSLPIEWMIKGKERKREKTREKDKSF